MRIFTTLFAFACWVGPVSAQYALQLVQPQELTLAARDFWNCIVVNSGNFAPDVYLHATITELKDGKIYDINSATFQLAVGTTAFNTQNFAVLAPEKILFKSNPYEEYLLRTNGLPRGEYRFCVELVDAGQFNVLATSCVDVVVAIATPPATILPALGDSICEANPFFIWTPPQPPLTGFDVSYSLFVHEVQGMQSPVAAVRSSPVWYAADNIGSPVFQYGIEGRPFVHGRVYAWYVVAFEGKKEASRSDISFFIWKNCNTDQQNGTSDGNSSPVLLNRAKKGVQYYQMPEFSESKSVWISDKKLNVVYVVQSQNKTVYVRLEDENGKALAARDLPVVPGYNYLSLEPGEWKMQNAKHHILTIMNEKGAIQRLRFWYQPKP